jgi:hypothetical protein
VDPIVETGLVHLQRDDVAELHARVLTWSIRTGGQRARERGCKRQLLLRKQTDEHAVRSAGHGSLDRRRLGRVGQPQVGPIAGFNGVRRIEHRYMDHRQRPLLLRPTCCHGLLVPLQNDVGGTTNRANRRIDGRMGTGCRSQDDNPQPGRFHSQRPPAT